MQRGVLFVVLLVLTGCQAPSVLGTERGPAVGGPGNATTTAPVATNGTEATGKPRATGGARPDPPEDRLGWENGYWYDEPIAVTTGDGLNDTERNAVVSRSMARVEQLRRLEFRQNVPVTMINRSAYQNQSDGDQSSALARFDNAKFEALFLVGERNDSLKSQRTTRGKSVLGYYSPAKDAIVIVSGSETPQLEREGTLAHELVHALQDQHFNLSDSTARTRDAYQARNGLVEGDAAFVKQRYDARCGDQWQCLSPRESGDTAAGDTASDSERNGDSERAGGGNFGIQFMMYFPYSDGPEFIRTVRNRGGWKAVNDAYDDVPDGSPEVIDPDRYSQWEPATVDLRDRSSGTWARVEPPGRPSYAVLGQSAIAASLAYTLVDDSRRSAVVKPTAVFNYRSDGTLNMSDPFEYGVPAADGWAGGKLFVYENATESGYVWKTKWETERDAREFTGAWSSLLRYWGGEDVDRDGTDGGDEHAGQTDWVIRDSEFADAFRLRRNGDTVTVVNAPTAADLSAVYDG